MPNLTEYAKTYIAMGLCPFPIKANSKQPATKNGHKDAISNPTDVDRLFKKHSGNIAVTFDETIFVLDIDTKHGDGYAAFEALEKKLGKLPPTLTAKTPSGGLHLFIRKPASSAVLNATNVLAQNIDVRTSKGYVVVEPSTIEGKSYSFQECDILSGDKVEIAMIPDAWLHELTNWKKPPATSETNDGEMILEGGRNDHLTRLAGSMRHAGFDSGSILAALTERNANHCKPPLLPNEVQSIARSVARYSPGIHHNLTKPSPPFPTPEPISSDEWKTARPTPDCIVQELLFADVAVLNAPGGMGKTTLMLKVAIHIALGRSLFGLKVYKPGAVLIISAEDSREMLIARERSIATDMWLSDDDITTVRERVRIVDLSGIGFKLTEVRGDVVRPCEGIDRIIEASQTLQPVLIVVDPAVSFGVGESRTNDAEQGLIEAGRKIKKELNCCVLYIHHSGKQNARDKAVDQYAGRGGSAFADGARMVHVLQPLTRDEWLNETGTELMQGESGLRLARPKMSYCVPQGDILIRRNGFSFNHVERINTNKETKLQANAEQVWKFLSIELDQGHYHSKNSLEQLTDTLCLTRNQVRQAVISLQSSLRVELRDMPKIGKGGKQTYLHPIASPAATGEPTEKSTKKEGILADEKF